jgi:endonuclease/exonuclease/phosphatase (EEP) superfamily protein YafD
MRLIRKSEPIRSTIVVLVVLLGIPACLATVLGLLGRFWWILELTSHFRVQYLIWLAIMATLLAILRRPRTALIFGGFAVVNAWFVVPLYWAPDAPQVADASECRILICNVQKRNRDFQPIVEYAREVDPDILVLVEVDQEWLAAMDNLRDMLPYCTSDPRSDNFGIALYSRKEPRAATLQRIGPAGVRSIVSEFGDGNRSFTVIATHPVPPQSRLGAELRNAQLEELGELIPTIQTPVVLVGDLNTTPWSYHYRRLIRQTGLVNASRGQGIRPTWPAFFPAFMQIPIDHCLCSDGIEVVKTHVGRDIGSDHAPLIVQLRVPVDADRRTAADRR